MSVWETHFQQDLRVTTAEKLIWGGGFLFIARSLGEYDAIPVSTKG